MAGTIIGSVLNTMSLDSVSATMVISPTGSVVNKVGTDMPVRVGPTNTWTRTSDTVASTITITHAFANGDKVAIFWGDTGRCFDAVVSAVSTTVSFTATVPAGQMALPATNATAIYVQKSTTVTDVTFDGNNLKQLLITSNTPSLSLLKDATAAVRHSGYLTTGGDFIGFPSYLGQATIIPYVITSGTFYNNSDTVASLSVVALV